MKAKHLLLISCVLLNQVWQTSGWCLGIGRNPTFVATPRVKQVDLTSVDISWANIVKDVECADNFLVNYWVRGRPNDFTLTEFIDTDTFSTTIRNLRPNVPYVFQVIAREDKGTLLGIDYNRSHKVHLTLSRKQVQTTTTPPLAVPSDNEDDEDDDEDEPLLADVATRIQADQEAQKEHRLFIIIGSVFAVLLILLIASGIAYQLYKKHRQKRHPDTEANAKYDKITEDCAIGDRDSE